MSASPLRILVIDDEEPIRDFIMLALRKEGYAVRAVEDGEEGLKALLTATFDLVLCDVRMPRLGGLELLDALSARDMHPTVIMMSAFGSRELAVEALKRGAYDYIEKPFKKDELLLTLLKAEERLKLKQENDALREGGTSGSFHGLIGSSERMREVFATITKVAAYTSTVLISGESGTGKELVARAVHEISPRARGPLVALNCGAIPEQLIESELFGHVRGAFTDAHSDKRGLFQEADGGTIFLDEIAELPLALQVKLLRVLEERQIRRVGDHRSVAIDVRVIAASLDLAERVQQGLFREDLYYRLNVIQITLPPLRQRREDLPALIQHFVELQNTRQGTAIRGVSQEALQLMVNYRWPGNVRELQNCIERGVVLTSGTHIGPDVLPAKIRESTDAIQQQLFSSDELSIKKMSASLERILIQRALERTGNNKTHAAQLLEISQRALHYKIKDYEIDC